MYNFSKILTLSLSILVVSVAGASAESFDATIIDVKNGNTVTAKINQHEYEVHLYGIIAPLMTQPYGKKAKKFLSQFLNKRVTIESVKKIDGNMSAVIYTFVKSRMTNINSHMVSQGLAWADTRSKKTAYISKQNIAKKKKLGLWAEPNPTEPWKYNDYLKKVQAENESQAKVQLKIQEQKELEEESASIIKIRKEREASRTARGKAKIEYWETVNKERAKQRQMEKWEYWEAHPEQHAKFRLAEAAEEARRRGEKQRQMEETGRRVETKHGAPQQQPPQSSCFEFIKSSKIHSIRIGMSIREAVQRLGVEPKFYDHTKDNGWNGWAFKLDDCTTLSVAETNNIIWSITYNIKCKINIQEEYNKLVKKIGAPLEKRWDYAKKRGGSDTLSFAWCEEEGQNSFGGFIKSDFLYLSIESFYLLKWIRTNLKEKSGVSSRKTPAF